MNQPPTTPFSQALSDYALGKVSSSMEELMQEKQLEKMSDRGLAMFKNSNQNRLKTLASGDNKNNKLLTLHYAEQASEGLQSQTKQLNGGFLPLWAACVGAAVVPVAIGLLTSTVIKESPLRKRVIAGTAAGVGAFAFEAVLAADAVMAAHMGAVNGLKTYEAQHNITHADKELFRRMHTKQELQNNNELGAASLGRQ